MMNLLPTDYHHQINLLHSLFVGPLLVWTGYKLNASKSLNTFEKLLLLITGVSVLAFHGMKAVQKQSAGLSITEDYSFQINALHLFFIGPLVAWTGWKLYKGKRVTDLEKSTLFFLGIAALIYHGYQSYQKYKKSAINKK